MRTIGIDRLSTLALLVGLIGLLDCTSDADSAHADCGDTEGPCLALTVSGTPIDTRLKVRFLDSSLQPLARYEARAPSGPFLIKPTSDVNLQNVRCIAVHTPDGFQSAGRLPISGWPEPHRQESIAMSAIGSIQLSPQSIPTGFTKITSVATAVLRLNDRPSLIALGDNGIVVIGFDSHGKPTVQPSIIVGQPVKSMAVADFSGDGLPDVVLLGNPDIFLLRNHGDGTFDPMATIGSAVALDRYLVAADFDNDTLPDIAIASTMIIKIFKNPAKSGTWPSLLNISTTATPDSLAVVQLGDSKNNSIVAPLNSLPTSMGIYQNMMPGTFAAETTRPLQAAAKFITAADLDGDGYADLVVPLNNDMGTGSFTVSIFWGAPNGSIPTTPKNITLTQSNFSRVAVATDIDGNSTPDLIIGNAGSLNIDVLSGDYNGTFVEKAWFGSGALDLTGAAAADLDGDCRADLAIANGSGSVQVLLNRPAL